MLPVFYSARVRSGLIAVLNTVNIARGVSPWSEVACLASMKDELLGQNVNSAGAHSPASLGDYVWSAVTCWVFQSCILCVRHSTLEEGDTHSRHT